MKIIIIFHWINLIMDSLMEQMEELKLYDPEILRERERQMNLLK